jgi:hypothetical protein
MNHLSSAEAPTSAMRIFIPLAFPKWEMENPEARGSLFSISKSEKLYVTTYNSAKLTQKTGVMCCIICIMLSQVVSYLPGQLLDQLNKCNHVAGAKVARSCHPQPGACYIVI